LNSTIFEFEFKLELGLYRDVEFLLTPKVTLLVEIETPSVGWK
jgi:hypothetical protein